VSFVVDQIIFTTKDTKYHEGMRAELHIGLRAREEARDRRHGESSLPPAAGKCN
jgi:hypothetical protein